MQENRIKTNQITNHSMSSDSCQSKDHSPVLHREDRIDLHWMNYGCPRRIYVNISLAIAFLYGFYLMFNCTSFRSGVQVFLPALASTPASLDHYRQGSALGRLFLTLLGVILAATIAVVNAKTQNSSEGQLFKTTDSTEQRPLVADLLTCGFHPSAPHSKPIPVLSLSATQITQKPEDENVNTPACSPELCVASCSAPREKEEDLTKSGSGDTTSDPYKNESLILVPGEDADIPTSDERPLLQEASHHEPLSLKSHFTQDLCTDIGTQTDATLSDEDIQQTRAIGTMTARSSVADASVNTHMNVCKIVKDSQTSTSGPFMKKLRRAQRFFKVIRMKTKVEKQDKVKEWRTIMNRYQEKLVERAVTMWRKDQLLGFTVSNRKLSEIEAQDISVTVRSSIEKLESQRQLNKKLLGDIENKTTVIASLAHGRQEPLNNNK